MHTAAALAVVWILPRSLAGVHVLFVPCMHDLFCLGVRAPLVLLASPFEGCSDFVMSMLCLRSLCFLASPYMHARARKLGPSVCFAHLTSVHVMCVHTEVWASAAAWANPFPWRVCDKRCSCAWGVGPALR